MPTYQYACTNPDCGNRFELVQTFTEPAASSCPVCAERVRKVYGSVGVVFKGSGFYRTDSRADARSGAKRDGSGESGAGSESGDKSAKKDGAAKATDAAPAGSSSSGSAGSSSGGSGSGSSGSGSSSAATAPAAATAS